MANHKSHSAPFSRKQDVEAKKREARRRMRGLLLENLESRQLLAVGPQLIGIQPNASDLLENRDVRTESPRELTFRFDESQVIDPATLDGIRLTSAGGDGSFGVATAESDFGSGGGATILLTASAPGSTFSVAVTDEPAMAAGEAPIIGLTGSVVSITLNTNPAGPTTAQDLVNAINASSDLAGQVTAQVNGGFGDAALGQFAASGYSPIALDTTHDQVITPGAALVGENPNENEVTLRFSEKLKDDDYRIQIFGFDDPVLGVVGLKNTDGELFEPTSAGTRFDQVDFRLDLGPQVISVVPQPVVRDAAGDLQQLRDTIVVYFDNEKLLVENDSLGRPTTRSAENPQFYKLIHTEETVRNTDDDFFSPVSVRYNAATNSATLQFAADINDLVLGGTGTFRLRIGTRETAPMTPTVSEAAATAITDLNTDGQVRLKFTARTVGEDGSGTRVIFVNSLSGTPDVTASGNTVTVDMGRNDLTAQELVDLIRVSSAASSLVAVDFEAGSDRDTVVGNTSLSFSPVTLLGLGGSFNTASDLGVIGSANRAQTSLILSSAIDAQPFELDLAGASDDAAHRQLPQNGGAFEDHVNPNFGPDSTPGIKTIYYNFQTNYSTTPTGDPLVNSMLEDHRQRAREVLSLWSNYIGVQFVETADLGVTIANGSFSGLSQLPGTEIQIERMLDTAGDPLEFGVRIDPTFDNSLIVMSANRSWGGDDGDVEYGDDYTRSLAAAMGMVLGLQHAGDLPETTLMRLDPEFLSGSAPLLDLNATQLNASDERYEPILPGYQDILHAQHLHRPDSADVDLFRFEVDLGDGQVGLLTAETYAQRLPNSSALNTNLELFRQTQASASTNLGVGPQVELAFEAVADGALGNQLQIIFTQTERNDSSAARITVFPNAIGVDLNANPNMLTSIQEVLDALNQSGEALQLVNVSLNAGDPSTLVGANLLPQNPVVLTGGQIDLVSQNDNYFSNDSLIRQSLAAGVYYLGVSASGNNDFNATLEDGGFGGRSQGDYDLRVTFRAEVDTSDTIQDIDGPNIFEGSVGLDGDGDGVPGGTYDFWFQTRPLHRSLDFVAGASAALEGRTVTVTGANGIVRVFEFDSDGLTGSGRLGIQYTAADSAGRLASIVADAINRRPELGVTATPNGNSIVLTGEQSIQVDSAITQIEIQGRTIFVDKTASTTADGSLERPFNNISAAGVPNAFAATHPGDIVRIVGNGGQDNNLATIDDNFAYEIGVGLLPGSTLEDGESMDVPQGVTTMIDAGAIFKLRQAAINVGSTNLNIDRSESALQVLGAPTILDADGNAIRQADGTYASGNVFFTSWLDESIGFDSYFPTTTPSPGDWGGISLQRNVDAAAGRPDLEDEGIFLRYVNHADIRYGGGVVRVDSVQTTVSSIQMLETRPTITDNLIQFGAEAAMSALPNSFEETNFHEPRFQAIELFTSDYDRVGPNIQRNTLVNNSLNGLFVRVATPADGETQVLSVPGRFDDTDVVHLITENVFVNGSPGGALLDSTAPDASLVSTAGTLGGSLIAGDYNYKLTFVDRNGYESVPSNPSFTLDLQVTANAISIAGLPSATGDFVGRKLYRSANTGEGPYTLVAELDASTSTFLDTGSSIGGTLARDRAQVSQVTTTPVVGGGTFAAGTYNYRIVMLDAGGREGLASNATINTTVDDGDAIQLNQLPLTLAGYIGRRIYRSEADGTAPYQLVGELLDTTNSGTTSFIDFGGAGGAALSEESFGVRRPRLNASLVVDPGSVLKLQNSRIEAGFGTSVIAEGLDGVPVVFTSLLDDTIGAGGTFDTNNNANTLPPPEPAEPGNWGGIYASPTSTLSIDHARFAYGGGSTVLAGEFRAFNTIEIQQAKARIANTLFEDNADGFGGQGPGTRFGLLSNAQSTVFVRGSQPAILDNIFRDNAGSAIEIDVLSLDAIVRGDSGRQTGLADQNPAFIANRGPLIRGNRLEGNDLNGLEIRASSILTSASVWDDTDIAHVVTEEILVGNVQHEGGLRLQSAPDESLVVKFDGYGSNFNDYLGAGLTAFGELSTGTERVGGTLHVVGQPGFPVILTSLKDDTVGAGLKPDGTPQNDTNNDGIGSVPQAADWRGLFLDQYSNDRNVRIVLETEDILAAAPGPNGFVSSAQVLGELASDSLSANENRRLGFTVEGVLSQNEDVDVYSFNAAAGTEVWLDVDYTKNSTDLVLELLDANGSLLARSDNSTAEALDPSLIFVSNLIDPSSVNPLVSNINTAPRTSSGAIKEDGTTNPNDPGLRVRLPGAAGSRSTFYFRIRSASIDATNFSAGLSSGTYQVQVRMQEEQEWAGSTVDFADIRYATNGVHLKGFPGSSPLIGEAAEDENVDASFDGSGETFANNGNAAGDGISSQFFFFGSSERQTGNRPQYLGNLLNSDKGGFSVAGELSNSEDVDFYRLDIDQEDIVGGVGNGHASVVFDIDYADGFDRPDTSINIFREEPSPRFGTQYRLVYSGDSSNITEDQSRPLTITDTDLTRGSGGTKDAYIGPVSLPEGSYVVGISSAAYQPRAKLLSPFGSEPINSILRVVDTGFNQGVTTAEPPIFAGFDLAAQNGAIDLLSTPFDLGDYAAEDLPNLYLEHVGGGATGFDVFIRDQSGVNTPIGTTNSAFGSTKMSLEAFAGQDNLQLWIPGAATANITRTIVGFAERGEALGVGDEPILLDFALLGISDIESTRVFSLETYDFLDGPSVNFDYNIINGNLDIFVLDPFFGLTRIATSDGQNIGPGETLLVAGAPTNETIDLSFWADRPNLQIVFQTRADDPTTVTVGNVHIQLADGSRVQSGEPNPTFTDVIVPAGTVTSGPYQLEIRMGETFFQSNTIGAPTLTQSFDTNHRFANQIFDCCTGSNSGEFRR